MKRKEPSKAYTAYETLRQINKGRYATDRGPMPPAAEQKAACAALRKQLCRYRLTMDGNPEGTGIPNTQGPERSGSGQGPEILPPHV